MCNKEFKPKIYKERLHVYVNDRPDNLLEFLTQNIKVRLLYRTCTLTHTRLHERTTALNDCLYSIFLISC